MLNLILIRSIYLILGHRFKLFLYISDLTNFTPLIWPLKDTVLLQYLDGTTDITRTVHFGKPSPHEKSCYTAVSGLNGIFGSNRNLASSSSSSFLCQLVEM